MPAFSVAVKGCAELMKGKVWGRAVTVVARIHVLVGLLLAVSLLLAL